MSFIIGVLMIVAGIILNITINRRRFYRRGAGGLQHFKTYSGSVFTTFFERIGKIIAIVLIIAGLALIVSGGKKSKIERKGYPGSLSVR